MEQELSASSENPHVPVHASALRARDGGTRKGSLQEVGMPWVLTRRTKQLPISLLWIGIAVGLPVIAGTQTPALVANDFGSRSSLIRSHADQLVRTGGTTFFVADTPSTGTELWKTDGTEAGTVLVKDIRPGLLGSRPSELTKVDGTLFLNADDGKNGFELWKSDGTAAGTVLVKDLRSGLDAFGLPASSVPTGLLNVSGTLFFGADDGKNGSELWKSDGTAAGTHDSFGLPASSEPADFANVMGTLFFRANDGRSGFELWKSNGTPEGTTLVRDIAPGAAGCRPSELTPVNERLFFRAFDAASGSELWNSDGTARQLRSSRQL
jgi:ELWxxDGT repeat protein